MNRRNTDSNKVPHQGVCHSRVRGLVWAYMGPPEHQPELPKLEWARVPESHRYIPNACKKQIICKP